jgi:1,4-alpha-glucan branching enzyme
VIALARFKLEIPTRLEISTMIEKNPHALGTVVTFRVDSGRPTSVVGDFNNWDPLITPMRPAGERTYELHLLLKPGRYSFRYLADEGHWFDDEAADAHEPDAFGARHGVLHVT